MLADEYGISTGGSPPVLANSWYIDMMNEYTQSQYISSFASAIDSTFNKTYILVGGATQFEYSFIYQLNRADRYIYDMPAYAIG